MICVVPVFLNFCFFWWVESIDDSTLGFVKATEPDGTEIDIEEASFEELEADLLFGEELTDANAMAEPADAAVVADEADIEVGRVGEGREAFGEGTG